MLELPILVRFIILVMDADGIILDFTKAVEIELPHERGEVVVFEELRDNVRGEDLGVFYQECASVR